jgi:hypothetical protein
VSSNVNHCKKCANGGCCQGEVVHNFFGGLGGGRLAGRKGRVVGLLLVTLCGEDI